uniref:Uncharacterized protein n=1 Tax=Arundo donax TaxID=35708 RepID=A0A0A8ZYG6_ARUDO
MSLWNLKRRDVFEDILSLSKINNRLVHSH